MRGMRDDLLRAAGARLIGSGTIRARLYDLGPYPGVKASSESSDRVQGEVHRLLDPARALAILDRYEGLVPAAPARSEFARDVVSVTLDDGSKRQAWAYFYNRPVDERMLVPSGDYRQRLSQLVPDAHRKGEADAR